jgi:hypothetical protein
MVELRCMEAASRSDAFYFYFDFDGIKNLFDIKGKRNFTEPHLSGKCLRTAIFAADTLKKLMH